ncbi:hypothetical protein [Spirillospora sp. CA-128828]|uniref:hypothetical protein n=1 Tax=Spirillospora sp. CA-128828 TaxID=3240033 RepID=UPI003D94E4D1
MAEQLDWHWRHQLRPWLDGLTDDEYFWEPAPDDLARPSGPAEAPYEDFPLGALALHINREVIHHGAEIALLRDLYLQGRERAWRAPALAQAR